MLVPHVLTPIPLSDLPDILVAGHHQARGFEPTPELVKVASAQLRLEHGVRDGALHGVWCFNLGNVDAQPGESPCFSTVPENEGHGSRVWTARHVRRAFESAEEGAAYYFDALLTRFPDAYWKAWDGDAKGYVEALKARGYFTGSESAYVQAVERMMRSES